MPKANVSLLLSTDSKGNVYPTASNVYQILRNNEHWIGILRHNGLLEADEYHPQAGRDPLGLEDVTEITDDTIFHVRRWLEGAIDWTRPPGKDLVADAVDAASRKQWYHPVKNYLSEIAGTWDHEPRIDDWLIDYCGVPPTRFARAAARKTLIGAAARAFKPGCKFDTMLVLVGLQGVRKSTAINILGRGWVSDTPLDIGHKDAYEALRGAWLLEVAELAGLGGKDVERLKAFFSSPVDTYRPAYARKTIRMPRSCAFIGSTNSTDFLKDPSGARRFWCVKVGDINTKGLEAVVDQLWAEAALHAMNGEPHWLTEEEARLAEAAALAFTSIDPWEEQILDRLIAEDLEHVHTATIYEWLDIETKDRHAGTAQRINRILSGRAKWHKSANPIWIAGKKGRGFSRNRPEESAQEEDLPGGGL